MTSLSTEENNEKNLNSNGWSEWLSHDWTLQEMIAPSDIQFFDKNGQPIGNSLRRCSHMSCHGLLELHSMYWRMGFQETDPALLRSSHGLSTRQRLEWRTELTPARMDLLEVSMLLCGEGKKYFTDFSWRLSVRPMTRASLHRGWETWNWQYSRR